jgi:hypothetical protein
VDVVPPLYTHWRVHADGSSGVIAFPFVHASDPEGTTTSLFPVFWRFWDRKTGAETAGLLPLFGWHHHPGAAGAFVGPVYGWKSTNGLGGWGGGVVPVAFFGRSETRRHAVIAPVFAHFSDERDGSATTLVGPVFHRRLAGGHGWDAGLFPVLWFGARDGRGYGYLPPLFFHITGERSTTDVIGPLYVRRGRAGWAAGLAPLLFLGNEDGRSHQVVLPPLFVRVAGPGEEKMLIGLFYHGREHARRVDVLFPLLYLRRAPGDGLMVAPLAGWRSTAREETAVVGPYIYHRNLDTGSRTHFFFPLVAVHDAPDYHVAVGFPFYWRIHEGAETDTALFPFYIGVRSPERKIDAIPPLLFVHARTTTAATTLFGPFWWRSRTDGGGSGGLFPLFAWGRVAHGDASTRWFGMPGAFYYHSDTSARTKVWAGPYFEEKHDGGWTAGVIPLAFAWKRGTVTNALAPFFYHHHDAAASSSLTVLGPLYFGHSPEGGQLGLFPLTFDAWHSDGRATASLFPLFYFHRKPGGSILATLLFGWSSYPAGWRAYVGPLYLRRDAERSSTALWPLFYAGSARATRATTRFLLPLYFDTRSDEGREFQEYTPLVWRYHSVERTVTVGLPLFVDVNNFSESRSTAFLPLFIRSRSRVDRSTSWVFPPILTWVRERAGAEPGHDAVVFPLFWRFGGKDPTTVVFPLGWDFQRGSSRTTVFAPLGAHWVRLDGEHLLFLNMYYRKGLGPKEGSWYVDVFPLAEFGRPRKGDVTWKVLEGLFGYSRVGRNRLLHLLWLFDIALEPAPASSLSWWSSTPPSARTEL